MTATQSPGAIHKECEHEPFTYRPYRRGYYRCHTCGQILPLSNIGVRIMAWMEDYLFEDYGW